MAPNPASSPLRVAEEGHAPPVFPLVDALRLIRTPNVGPVTFFNLVSRFGSPGEALAHLPQLAARGGAKSPLSAPPREAVEAEIAAAEKFGARFLVIGSADYPSLLASIADPPPVLTVMGDVSLLARGGVALVGARNASANGCAFAGSLAKKLAGAGFGVVSGLARGIDTFAHQGALKAAQGATVAVVAGGIDTVYPPENEALTREIRARGLVVSEQPFGQAPFAGAFPSRNRIISGISRAVAVVEASPKSGSLITARLCLEQNRELFAVPGHPLDPRAAGCNGLLKEGAHLLEDAEDIVHVLAGVRVAEDAGRFRAAPAAEPEDGEMRRAHALILEKISFSPVDADALARQCALLPALAQAAFTELELAGKLTREPGGRIRRAVEC